MGRRVQNEMASYVSIGCTRTPVVGSWKANGIICLGAQHYVTNTKPVQISPRIVSSSVKFTCFTKSARVATILFRADADKKHVVCVCICNSNIEIEVGQPQPHGGTQCMNQQLFSVSVSVPDIDIRETTMIIKINNENCHRLPFSMQCTATATI
jgi:hypothetical protein